MYFNYIVPVYMLLSDMWLIVYIVYSVHNYDLLSANESGTCKLNKNNQKQAKSLEAMRVFLLVIIALSFSQLLLAGKGGLFKSPLTIFKSKNNDRNIFKDLAQVTIHKFNEITDKMLPGSLSISAAYQHAIEVVYNFCALVLLAVNRVMYLTNLGSFRQQSF